MISKGRTWSQLYHDSIRNTEKKERAAKEARVRRAASKDCSIPALPEFYITYNRGDCCWELWQKTAVSGPGFATVLLSREDTHDDAVLALETAKTRAKTLMKSE
jgi:hypothetical protein